jgi:uncharacterized protein
MNDRYTTFSGYVKKKFGRRVQKVTVDAGFTCPNRDGSKGTEGCIYCDNEGFSPAVQSTRESIPEQIRRGIESARAHRQAEAFMVYFQAYSNTYAPVAELKEKYEHIRSFDGVVSLAVGTRPDCIDTEKLRLLDSYAAEYEVWVEYGLQSAHDKTLAKINRAHTRQDFLDAIALTRQFPRLKICTHLIFGLPGETAEDMHASVTEVARVHPDGIKFHPLHAVRGTRLAELYSAREWQPLGREEYVRSIVRAIRHLPPDTVIQRLSADCPAPLLVAPAWLSDKSGIIRSIEAALGRENARQGDLFCL